MDVVVVLGRVAWVAPKQPGPAVIVFAPTAGIKLSTLPASPAIRESAPSAVVRWPGVNHPAGGPALF